MDMYFQILGLSSGASQEEIKKAYRELALKHHPDHGGNEEEFKKINEAYQFLTGKQKSKNQPNSSHQGFNPFEHMNMEIDYDMINEILRRSQAQNAYNKSKRKHYKKAPEHDSQVHIGFEISIEDVKNGREFEFEYKKSVTCNKCNGIGGKEKETCKKCNGIGRLRYEQKSGNFFCSTEGDCDSCDGTGSIIKDMCEECEGNGFVNIPFKIKLEIKEK